MISVTDSSSLPSFMLYLDFRSLHEAKTVTDTSCQLRWKGWRLMAKIMNEMLAHSSINWHTHTPKKLHTISTSCTWTYTIPGSWTAQRTPVEHMFSHTLTHKSYVQTLHMHKQNNVAHTYTTLDTVSAKRFLWDDDLGSSVNSLKSLKAGGHKHEKILIWEVSLG